MVGDTHARAASKLRPRNLIPSSSYPSFWRAHAFSILGLEKELAVSHGETEMLRQHLNDLEDCHDVLPWAALDEVGTLGTRGMLLPDRLQGPHA